VPQRAGTPGHNPTGRNQYSYRKDWEREVEQQLRSDTKGNGTVLKAIVNKLLGEAERGKPWAVKLVLARVWPEVVKHEVDHTSAPPPVSPLENLSDEDRTTMLRLAQKAIRGGDTDQ
jgi:hypothetical protein